MKVELLSEISEELEQDSLQHNTANIGNTYHQSLLLVSAQGGHVPQTLYAMSDTKLAIESLSGDTAYHRAKDARIVGRLFADEFGVSKVNYLVQQALCFTSEANSGYMPNDDPHRRETAITIVAPIRALCEARTPQEHMDVLNRWDVRIWQTDLHEGMPEKDVYQNALMVTSANHKSGNYDKDEESIAVFDSMILGEAVIGLSKCFPGIHVSAKGPFDQAIAVELMTRRLDEYAKSLK